LGLGKRGKGGDARAEEPPSKYITGTNTKLEVYNYDCGDWIDTGPALETVFKFPTNDINSDWLIGAGVVVDDCTGELQLASQDDWPAGYVTSSPVDGWVHVRLRGWRLI
jgi:hypothetical protein